MNNTQRLDFWKTLCSLDGKNPENDCTLLGKKITFPRYLYRYRAVNGKNLEALLHNHLFFLLRITLMIHLIPFSTSTFIRFSMNLRRILQIPLALQSYPRN